MAYPGARIEQPDGAAARLAATTPPDAARPAPEAAAWPAARDWNVVVTVHEGGYPRARSLLAVFGEVRPSGYFNLLLLRVEDLGAFLARLARMVASAPEVLEIVSRVAPAQACFDFLSAAEFVEKSSAILLGWADRIAGRSFHVRMHRRGAKNALSASVEERRMNDLLLAAADGAGHPARIAYDAPDAIIDVQIVNQRAGLSLWTRAEMSRYVFLRLK